MITIRQLTAADATDYQRLRLQAVATDPQAFLSTLETEQTKQLRQFTNEIVFSSMTTPFGYFGLFSDQLLIGFLQLGTTGLTKQRHIAYLYNLYLEPTYRGQHLATKLCQEILAIARINGIERVFAVALASNQPALVFYQSLGFTICGQRTQSVKWQDEYDDEVELIKVL